MFFNGIYTIFSQKYNVKYKKNVIKEFEKAKAVSKEEVDKLYKAKVEQLKEESAKDTQNYLKLYSYAQDYSIDELNAILDRCENVTKEVDFEEVPKKPVLHPISEEKSQQRKELANKVREKIVSTCTNVSGISSLSASLHPDVQLERVVFTLTSSSNLDDAEKIKKMNDMVANKTPENEQARKEFLENKIRSLIDLAEELANPMTDEEFVDRYQDRMFEIFQLTELQEGNISTFTGPKGFGVKIDPKLEAEWHAKAGLLVASGSQINRFGMICNPLYTKLEVDEIKEMGDYIGLLAGNDSKLMDQYAVGCGEKNITTAVQYENYAKKLEDGTLDPNEAKYLFDITLDGSKTLNLSNFAEYSYGILSDAIKAKMSTKYNLKPEEFDIVNFQGEKIDSMGAGKNVYNGLGFSIVDKNGKTLEYFKNDSIDKTWSTFSFNKPKDPIDLKNAPAEELDQKFKAMKEAVGKTTHWYLRSSQEYRDFRKSLNNLIKEGYDDRDKLMKNVKDLGEKAAKYLSIKEPKIDEEGNKTMPKINSNTIPRIAAAMDAVDLAMGSQKYTLEVELKEQQEKAEQEEMIKKGNEGVQQTLDTSLTEQFVNEKQEEFDFNKESKANEKELEEEKNNDLQENKSINDIDELAA